MDRITLIADDGMYYTNGVIYGKQIHLAEGMTTDGFYQITEEEYNAIPKEDDEIATEEDYINALERFGVE